MQGVAFTALALYLTVLSGYLVAAYIVGAELNRFQVIFINSIFLLFSIPLALYFFVVMYLGIIDSPGGSAADWVFYFLYVFGAGQILAVLGALKFMHDIRVIGQSGNIRDDDT